MKKDIKMKLKRIAIAVAAILFASSAQAQVPPPVLQQAPVFGSFYLGARSPDVSATTTSGTSAVALGTAAGVAYVCNTGSNNAYFRLGASTITVTAANGIPLIAGQCGNFYAIGATHIVGITATSTATLQTAMGWGSAFAAGGGSGGGGGGSVTQGTSPWVDNITQWASTVLGAPSNFGTTPGAVLVPGVNAAVISSALPAGASTAALQTSGGAKTQIVSSGGTSATLTGTALDVNVANTCASGSGQQTMSGSCPIVIASNQSSIPVAATLNAETTKVIGTVNLSTGQSIALTTGTADIGNVGGSVNVTPTNCGGTITSGGTAQNAITAQSTLSGLMIANIDTSEPMWISFTSTAAASDTQSYPLPAGAATTFAGFGSYSSQFGFGVNTALSVIAATTGHKFTCTRW